LKRLLVGLIPLPLLAARNPWHARSLAGAVWSEKRCKILLAHFAGVDVPRPLGATDNAIPGGDHLPLDEFASGDGQRTHAATSSAGACG
jgi:hypothetical protein